MIWGLEWVGVSLDWTGDTGFSECGLTVYGNVGLALQPFSHRPSTHGSLSFKEGMGKKKVG